MILTGILQRKTCSQKPHTTHIVEEGSLLALSQIPDWIQYKPYFIPRTVLIYTSYQRTAEPIISPRPFRSTTGLFISTRYLAGKQAKTELKINRRDAETQRLINEKHTNNQK